MPGRVERPTRTPQLPHRKSTVNRPSTFMERLVMASESPSIDSVREPRLSNQTPRVLSEPLSIPPSSASSSESEIEDVRLSDRSLPPEKVESSSPVSAVDEESKAPVAESVTKSACLDDSFIIPSAALAQKARRLMERELMFEKIIAKSKADLEILEEQINDLGTGYLAVSRSVTSRPPRRVLEIPEDELSPIRTEQKENSLESKHSERLKSTPPFSRPPLAPANRRPLLTNVPLSPNFN